MYRFEKLGPDKKEQIKTLFFSVFTAEPWNDDWSDEQQLDLYIDDLLGQGNSLTYGVWEDSELLAIAMGRSKHWYTGTEYCIDEFCVRTDRQGQGIGTYFLTEIEAAIKAMGFTHIFLQTEKNVPAYDFYLKNGFYRLPEDVSFAKKV